MHKRQRKREKHQHQHGHRQQRQQQFGIHMLPPKIAFTKTHD